MRLILGMAALLACSVVFAQAPAPAPATDTWTVKEGDTLSKIATERYGHGLFGEVLALYNNVDPTKLKIGQVIKTPDLAVIAKEEKLIPTVGAEMEALIKAHGIYRPLAPKLVKMRADGKGRMTIPEEIKKELTVVLAEINKAAEGLGQKKPGVVEAPAKTIGQLRSAAADVTEISDGNIDENASNVDSVNQRFAYAFTYAIKWARNGFK